MRSIFKLFALLLVLFVGNLQISRAELHIPIRSAQNSIGPKPELNTSYSELNVSQQELNGSQQELNVSQQELNDSIPVYFEQNKLRFRTSFEKLKMSGEPNLGMLGIGVDYFPTKALPQFYLTLNSYSAVLGQRPGLITFGTGLGWHQPLFNSPFALDGGLFLGGGGGGGAPDGGGLITRGHIQLHYQISDFSLFGGWSKLDFPTGAMGSDQFQFGLSYAMPFYRAIAKPVRKPVQPANPDEATSKTFRLSVNAQNYLLFSGKPTHDNGSAAPKEGEIMLLGVGMDQFINENWYATLKLHGAMAGGIDGYMSYLVGVGVEDAIRQSTWKWDAQLVAGPSGGGRVATGGGAIVQGTLGLRKAFDAEYDGKIALGQTWTPQGSFGGTFLEVGVSKSFDFISPKQHQDQGYSFSSATYKKHLFEIGILNRTYFSPALEDKNGRPYDRMFNLLGFTFTKPIHKNWDVIGATFWAYQGSYGAYAEGLLGAGYRKNLAPKWNMKLQALGGAAGGGGIDLGSGLVFQYQFALERALNSAWSVQAGFGQMQGVRGNFNPTFLDLGIQYKIEKIQRRPVR
jgi:hypothetical protein